MYYKLSFICLVSGVLYGTSAYSDVYKCRDINGVTAFTDTPCLDGKRKQGNAWISLENKKNESLNLQRNNEKKRDEEKAEIERLREEKRKKWDANRLKKMLRTPSERSSHTSNITPTPIEHDAEVISTSTTKAYALAVIVRHHGYRCDSISNVRPFFWGGGYNIVCNHFSYSYDASDKGGGWVVTPH